MQPVANEMIDGSLQEDRNFEKVAWSDLVLEHGKMEIFQKYFLIGVNDVAR